MSAIYIPAEHGYRWVSRSLLDAAAIEAEFDKAFPTNKHGKRVGIGDYGMRLGEPVIAWKICPRDGPVGGRPDVTPVTIRGEVAFKSRDTMEGILLPDGRVYVRGEPPYQSMLAFLAEMVERASDRGEDGTAAPG